MSFDFTSTANHADSTGTPIAGAPFALSIWVKTTLAQFRHILGIVKIGDSTQALGIILDSTSTSGKPGAYASVTGNSTQIILDAPLPVGVWTNLIMGSPNTGSRNITQNGVTTKVSPVGIFVPAGLNGITISGRQGDHLQNIGGLAAHAAIFAGDLSATAKAFIGAGGNVRALASIDSYYKLNRTTSGGLVIPDETGLFPLNVTGVMNAGADDPATASWMTGGPVANLLLAQGAAVNVNLAASFDNVSSAFTCSLQQLGAATQVTTTVGAAATAAQEAVLSSSAAFSAGDYVQIGVGGTPQPVYFVNPGIATIFFGNPVTWAAGAPVFRFPVSARPIPGCAVAGNALTGNTTTAANYASCFIRATCNASSALFADSNLINIAVANALPASLTFRKRRRRIYVTAYTRR